jgi:ABC-type polar amino acid transport system ATPase subunit
MALSRIEIKDFLVFKGEFRLDFCPGVNVFIGGNATGKTTLLKALHARDDSSTHSLFIPVAEMLSHSQGFLELNAKYQMPFDKTQIDILVNAGLPETREVSPFCQKLLDQIRKVIGGEVVYEDGKYSIAKAGGQKIEYAFEASGFQKFGLLWKLLRNGLLEPGATLFWDEPEASINPELMSTLAEILLELSRNGVQVFVATHSEILAGYFQVGAQAGDSLLFHSLDLQDGQVKADSGDRFDLLTPNNLTA